VPALFTHGEWSFMNHRHVKPLPHEENRHHRKQRHRPEGRPWWASPPCATDRPLGGGRSGRRPCLSLSFRGRRRGAPPVRSAGAPGRQAAGRCKPRRASSSTTHGKTRPPRPNDEASEGRRKAAQSASKRAAEQRRRQEHRARRRQEEQAKARQRAAPHCQRAQPTASSTRK